MSWYRASTISLTNGSTAVTGAATDFIANCAVGEGLLAPDGKVYEIAAIVSATALTLGSVYLGSTASGQSYAIIPSQSYLRDLALQAATLVNDYQSVLDSAGAGKFGDGTLGSPGIQFSSDSNSGIRRTGTDALAVVTGGVDRITVDAAGAVAVVASLSVAGSAVPTIASTSTLTNKTLALGSNTISGTLAQFNTAVTDADLASLAGTETLTNKTLTNPSYSGATANGGTVTTIDINGGTIDGTVIGGTTPAAVSATTLSASGDVTVSGASGTRTLNIQSNTSGDPTLTLTAAGDNAASLSYVRGGGLLRATMGASKWELVDGTGLAVTGALSATGKITQSGTAGYEINNGSVLGEFKYSGGLVINRVAGGSLILSQNGNTEATLDASGNLGLGVTPSAWNTGKALQIGGAGLSLWNANNAGDVWLTSNSYYNAGHKYSATNGASAYEQNAGVHRWYTAPSGTAGNAITFTQAMTLDSLGRLIVGTTTPVGMITADGQDAYYSAYLTQGAAASNCLALHNRATTGDNAFAVFGTEASVTARGSITYNRGGGLVAYNTTSDYRAKDVYGPVLDSGSQVDALKVYRGKMKGATMERPMLIAHEAQEVAPYAVSGVKDAINEDGTPLFQQVDTSSLVPLLIAELQSLRQRVAQLEGI